ncbi:uncharacterized protein KQ657_004175 [Scheffersomyces spartinae]|uniref:Uncharacterized protein n=1 Tax=Scheffersomyces spartinae TaxID=45513 RepID=A0A9P8AJR5_9ASCO|nr:uncharacterized protein KQ657_004175 [Scheffersomyces spartinae]KAG7195061.1 hypothetical protein KQ657_004175 [Scheffersomyces spartinae]
MKMFYSLSLSLLTLKMQFSASTLSFATLIACAAAFSNTTVTEYSTTDITITSCSDNKCTETTLPASLSVVTETVNGVETIYTTICPETETTPVPTTVEMTTVTTTVEGTVYTTVCPVTEVTPMTTITTTVEGTVYTTVCPVSEVTVASTSATPVAPVSTSEGVSYVDLTTTPVVTVSSSVEATSYKQLTLTSYYASSAGNATVAPEVSTFEGKAAQLAVGVAGFAGLAAVLL